MPARIHLLTLEVFTELLCTAARRPSRHCANQPLLRTSTLRHASTSAPPPPFTSPTQPQSKPSLPPTATATAPPLRMLLDRNPENRSAISKIPIPRGEKGENFVPQPLARPLGLPYPPEPGQNSPVDARTLAQKKADFSSRDEALKRRNVLLRTFLRPYFQEWKRLDKEYKGKSFVSNERLFRADKALWFPNMYGRLLRGGNGADTTPVLKGRVSVVGIQSGVWAEEQVGTFLGEKENPLLKELLEERRDLQRVDINIQGDLARQFFVWLFQSRLRKSMPESQWGRYFMVKLPRDVGKGLSEEARDAMGLLNSQVGYVYLLDRDCRIRWAGSGHAWKGEVDSLNNGVRKLLGEATLGDGAASSVRRKATAADGSAIGGLTKSILRPFSQLE